jgi:ribonuclease HI
VGKIEIFTDGGCQGNPGPGGWAYVLVSHSGRTSSSGSEDPTTNNRMELTAVIRALEAAKGERLNGEEVSVATDSQYVQKGITAWILTWKRNGWRTSGKEPVKNRDLWERLDELSSELTPRWTWVKGHAGHPENEECDALVQEAIKRSANGRSFR